MIEQTTTLSRWGEFNRLKWRCGVEHVKLQSLHSEATGECLFFFNERGKFVLPPQNPYHPSLFRSTVSHKPYRTNKQWHEIANLLMDRLLQIRGSMILHLPPDITDIRPFLWRGFKAEVKYTYCVQLPYSLDLASKSIRNKIRKATAGGYRTFRSDNMEHAYQCLRETEKRQGFSHRLTVQDLELARDLMGEDTFRCYICYSKEGEPVSANLSLLLSPKRAIGWIAGTKSAHLTNGVAQQVQSFEFEDLAALGVREFDFTGANLASVSESKADWGGELLPYYVVRKPGIKEMLRAGRDWLQFDSRINK